MPVGPSASRLAILSDSLSLGPKHPKAARLQSSDDPLGSILMPLNPTIAHTKKLQLASIIALAGFIIFDFPARKCTKPSAYDIDRGLILSNT
jgi:hypothetical protein